ncbi:hypothetical protein AB0K05_24940 [Nonomuraea sp. NPDC049486]|uniref:hypothetical protein n=1 Tax=Nonomuraea sp. NPDC049486 TaxID=3155773 RepID=UPI00342C5415
MSMWPYRIRSSAARSTSARASTADLAMLWKAFDVVDSMRAVDRVALDSIDFRPRSTSRAPRWKSRSSIST